VSPDGLMVAFIREAEPSFPVQGEVFVKRLPGSEAVQLTHDGHPKYGVAFSPDGSEVTYTLAANREWNTMAVSVLGGEPRVVLTNASGLKWVTPHQVLFSELTGGLHMGLVTSTETRADLRRIYLPAHERGMAHEASLSPDRRWVLVVEMGADGAWQPCRLVPFDGSSPGNPVGPPGSHCTAAAWSSDGSMMYFTASSTGVRSHIWRQRFPNGSAEQFTNGPEDEHGLAMSADGRSLLTAIGTEASELWMRNEAGERLLSSEGFAWAPSYSQDGQLVYYMLGGVASARPSELWMLDVNSGRSRPIVQGFLLRSYDVSEDGRTIVFCAVADDGRSELWLASADHSSAPRRLSSSGSDSPFFGSGGRIVFRASEGKANYLFEMDSDGSHRHKIRGEPIIELQGHSADRRWAVSMVPADEGPVATVLVPLEGGEQRRVCPTLCNVRWSPSGDRVYVQPARDFASGDALVFPLPAHDTFPTLSSGAIASIVEGASLAGASVVHLGDARNHAVPGPSPDTFVYTKTVAHRNLFWVSLK
jgi:Tol biopolymer transport system component